MAGKDSFYDAGDLQERILDTNSIVSDPERRTNTLSNTARRLQESARSNQQMQFADEENVPTFDADGINQTGSNRFDSTISKQSNSRSSGANHYS